MLYIWNNEDLSPSAQLPPERSYTLGDKNHKPRPLGIPQLDGVILSTRNYLSVIDWECNTHSTQPLYVPQTAVWWCHCKGVREGVREWGSEGVREWGSEGVGCYRSWNLVTWLSKIEHMTITYRPHDLHSWITWLSHTGHMTHTAKSHSRRVLSQDPESANCPSELMTMSETKWLCPLRARLAMP